MIFRSNSGVEWRMLFRKLEDVQTIVVGLLEEKPGIKVGRFVDDSVVILSDALPTMVQDSLARVDCP